MKKGLFYISFISLLILFWAGTALAISAPNLISPEDGIKLPLGSEVTLKWSAVSDASKGYHFYVSYPSGKTYHEKDNYQSTEVKSKLPFSGGTYKWKVRACQTHWWLGTKCGEWSPEWSIILGQPTAPAPAPGPAPVSPPTITSVNPTKGATRTTITITGNNFDSVCSENNIIFEQIDGYGETTARMADSCPASGSTLTSKIPPFSGVGENLKIRVETSAGTSNFLNFLIEGRPDGNLTGTGSDGGQKPKWEPQVKWPKNPLGVSLQGDSLTNLVEYLYGWGISLGGFAAFVVLIMAGIQYLTSAGDAGKMKDAMDKIRNAVIGLVMLFASLLILNTINPQLTQLKMPSLGETFTSQCFDCIEKNENDWKKKCVNECGLIAEDEIDITTKCEVGARIYTASDCQGSGQLMEVGGVGKNITCEKQGTCSIKAEEKNMCAAEFYDKIGCMGDPMANPLPVSTGCVNIESLRFEKTIQCIKIKKP